MQIGTGDTKLAKARHGLKPAVVGMSIGTGELVTACLETNILAMEVSTARAKLAVAILMKLTYIGVHVHKQRLGGENWRQRGELGVLEVDNYPHRPRLYLRSYFRSNFF